MKRLYTILTLLFLALNPVFSQVTLKVQAPSQAEVGQRIRISYVANTQDIEDFQVGSFEGFNVLYGPSTSRSSSFSMTNGRTTQSSSVTFTYTVVPIKEGTLQVPAATIMVEGKAVKSDAPSMEVLPASDYQDPQSSNQQQGNGSTNALSATRNKCCLSFKIEHTKYRLQLDTNPDDKDPGGSERSSRRASRSTSRRTSSCPRRAIHPNLVPLEP